MTEARWVNFTRIGDVHDVEMNVTAASDAAERHRYRWRQRSGPPMPGRGFMQEPTIEHPWQPGLPPGT